MLKHDYAMVNITGRNKRFYLEKGYIESNVGNKIQVKLEDLPESCGSKLHVICDYCDDEYIIRFCDYKRSLNKEIGKDACEKCWHLKRQDVLNQKIKNGSIDNKTTRGYWSIPKNIYKELDDYIKEHGFAGKTERNNDESNNRWNMIHFGLKNNNLNLSEVIKELGYDEEDVLLRRPNGYYSDFSVLEKDIRGFIEENGRFPTQRELSKDLKIHRNDYSKHGNLNEIKSKMEYDDSKDLIDGSGYINRSIYEVIVANYLIKQNIPYKREMRPFKKFDKKINYKSDFTFYKEDGKEIHCEIWGGARSFNNQRSFFEYDEKMKEKISLYKDYNIKLISIYPDIFYYSMRKIKESLKGIFQELSDVELKDVEDPLLSTFRLKHMSHKELFNEIIKYQEYEGCLPTTNRLRTLGKEFLYTEVLKRFDGYHEFANEFNMRVTPHSKKELVKIKP